jgi:hypothetical protein
VPSPNLPSVLAAIEEVLAPGGLLYVGTWGGADEEGPRRDDHHPVPRFFAFRSDGRMREALAERFYVLSFTIVDVGGNRFQSFMLEKPAGIQTRRKHMTCISTRTANLVPVVDHTVRRFQHAEQVDIASFRRPLWRGL